MKWVIALLLPAFLAGCGTLPQPFLGRPGPEGAMLSVPPPPVLIVPPPRAALLGNAASRIYAGDLAAALVGLDVPSLVQPAGRHDWRLIARAKLAGQHIVPEFSVVGPTGQVYGKSTGSPVSAEAWSQGDGAILKAVANDAAPDLARQLGGINARIQQSNPLSLENRPPRALLKGVAGAPGDGDHSLALDARRDLAQLGIVMVTHAKDADFVIDGRVKASPTKTPAGSPGAELVELDWTVRSQSGTFIGKVSQLHDLQAAQMAPYWGDVAVAAAEQASLGLKQVMVNAIPKRAARSPDAASHPGHARPVTPPAP